LDELGSDVVVLGRLALAALLGAVVGWEREAAGKEAGLRTMTLVSAASALFTLAGAALAAEDPDGGDPLRAVQAIAIGVGFLGAGAVRAARGGILGLTTAATVWAVAAIGIVAAVGRYRVAVGATVLFLGVLRLMARLERPAQPR
jgi:putative Mg2+ transporter-C (MgtC) family protein